MSRNFNRTMLISSFIAACGSFLIDLGTAFTQVAVFFGIELHALHTMDRAFAILACVMVIAFPAGGLIVLQVLRGFQRDQSGPRDTH